MRYAAVYGRARTRDSPLIRSVVVKARVFQHIDYRMLQLRYCRELSRRLLRGPVCRVYRIARAVTNAYRLTRVVELVDDIPAPVIRNGGDVPAVIVIDVVSGCRIGLFLHPRHPAERVIRIVEAVFVDIPCLGELVTAVGIIARIGVGAVDDRKVVSGRIVIQTVEPVRGKHHVQMTIGIRHRDALSVCRRGSKLFPYRRYAKIGHIGRI